MNTPYEARLELLIHLFVTKMNKEFDKKVSIARNKTLVTEELIESFNQGFILCFTLNEFHKDLIGRFCYYYKRGFPIDDLVIKESKQIQEIIDYGEKLERGVRKLKNPYRVVNFLARFAAYYEFIKIKGSEFGEIQKKIEEQFSLKIKDNTKESEGLLFRIKEYYNLTDSLLDIEKGKPTNKKFNDSANVIWTGDKVSFIKLIYALYYSDNINKDVGTLSNFVEDAAKFFNVNLGKNWQAALSEHLNGTKNQELPFEFFENLNISFKKYIERRKKNKT